MQAIPSHYITMDLKALFAGLIFLMPGAISTLASLFNWDWFFSTKTASFFVDNLGRTGARVFYGVLGIALLIAAVMIIQSLVSQS